MSAGFQQPMQAPLQTDSPADLQADFQAHGQLALRPMAIGEVDAVAAIEAGIYSHPWTRGNFIDSLAAGYHAQVLDQPGEGPIGYFVAMAGVDEMHLLNITVAPSWQGCGHGSRMLDAVRRMAQQSACASLWLEVRESNRHAREIYLRRGFTVVGRRRDYYPAASRREDALVMSLALPRP